MSKQRGSPTTEYSLSDCMAHWSYFVSIPFTIRYISTLARVNQHLLGSSLSFQPLWRREDRLERRVGDAQYDFLKGASDLIIW
jgi:hypothetical protein